MYDNISHFFSFDMETFLRKSDMVNNQKSLCIFVLNQIYFGFVIIQFIKE